MQKKIQKKIENCQKYRRRKNTHLPFTAVHWVATKSHSLWQNFGIEKKRKRLMQNIEKYKIQNYKKIQKKKSFFGTFPLILKMARKARKCIHSISEFCPSQEVQLLSHPPPIKHWSPVSCCPGRRKTLKFAPLKLFYFKRQQGDIIPCLNNKIM